MFPIYDCPCGCDVDMDPYSRGYCVEPEADGQCLKKGNPIYTAPSTNVLPRAVSTQDTPNEIHLPCPVGCTYCDENGDLHRISVCVNPTHVQGTAVFPHKCIQSYDSSGAAMATCGARTEEADAPTTSMLPGHPAQRAASKPSQLATGINEAETEDNLPIPCTPGTTYCIGREVHICADLTHFVKISVCPPKCIQSYDSTGAGMVSCGVRRAIRRDPQSGPPPQTQ
ncbi:hypothetical protein BCR34DRAFT_339800 [Clohesyomyces aquaticus]|uniref:Uncharacterized protein n=1 Tax=Clohesyomyces aquaticus TaxID=1231657 RepID=A0A1Y1ZKE3_9PLEO|nr:hypothetical protein BCR34DRAFT_339800 [Clohesyomyces aquaticus]